MVYNSHHSGVGEGRWGAAGRHSVTCYEALVREHPRETKAGDNYGAGTKLVLLSPFTRRFKAEEKVKQRRMQGTSLFSEQLEIFRRQTLAENEINLRARR